MVTRTAFLLRPIPPFRLDLTAWALRRRPENQIDRWDGSTYQRVLVVNDTPFEISVTQARNHGDTLSVSIHGKLPARHTSHVIKQALEGALGIHQDLQAFYRVARRDRKLAPLVDRFRGMKPPRFFSVFEGLVNGIACQQLSLSLGIQLLNRLARNFGLGFRRGNSLTYAFPRPAELANLKPEQIRKLGFSLQKARALVDLSCSIVEGRLDLEALAGMPDEEALQRLMEVRGVGRWTAEYTLLRGMGRWHIFPVDDQGARNGLMRWLRLREPPDSAGTQHILAGWRPYGGLIYFHMLMNGLDEAGYLQGRRDGRYQLHAGNSVPSILVADCVRVPDGRIGRVRAKSGNTYRIRLRRVSSQSHQFLTFQATELTPINCPKGWMTPEGYLRYLQATLPTRSSVKDALSRVQAFSWQIVQTCPKSQSSRASYRARHSIRAPELPVGFPKRHIRLGVIRMAFHSVHVQIGPQAWSFWNLKIAIHEFRFPGQQILLPLHVEGIKMLLHIKVRRARCNLKARESTDRSLGAVGHNHAVVGLHEVRDFAGTKNASHMERLKGDDIDCFVSQQLDKLLP
jgi:DNA-3-methyladenine glycosylase II